MVSDVEIRRGGRSFTVDTVRYFVETMRGRPEFFLLMGADQFAEIETWKDCDELIKSCNIVVHNRRQGGADATEADSLAALKRFGYVKTNDSHVHPSGHTLSFVATTFLPISATMIRRKLSAHQSIAYLLAADVADYIQRHGLY